MDLLGFKDQCKRVVDMWWVNRAASCVGARIVYSYKDARR